jgi:SulP family sulfate permease
LGVDLGIFIGIGISLFMVIAHTSVPHITILGKEVSGSWVDASKDSTVALDPATLVVRIEEALYFANIEQIKDMFKRIEVFGNYRAHPTAKVKTSSLENIIVHCKNITEMDASAIQTMGEMTVDYHNRDIFVCFVKPRPEIRDMFLRAGIVGALGGDRIFKTVDEAVTYATARKKDKTQK